MGEATEAVSLIYGMAQMPARRFEILPFEEGFIIEVEWLDGDVDRMPGLFSSEDAAADCLCSEQFAHWLRQSKRARESG